MLLLPLFLLLPNATAGRLSRETSQSSVRRFFPLAPFSFLLLSLFSLDYERVRSERGARDSAAARRCRPGKVTVTFSSRATVNLLDLLAITLRSSTHAARASIAHPSATLIVACFASFFLPIGGKILISVPPLPIARIFCLTRERCRDRRFGNDVRSSRSLVPRLLFPRAFTFRSFGRRPKLAVTALIGVRQKHCTRARSRIHTVSGYIDSRVPPFRPSIARNYWYPCSFRLAVRNRLFCPSRGKKSKLTYAWITVI